MKMVPIDGSSNIVRTDRRALLRGLGALLAAPAIVRVASIMPVKPVKLAPATYGRSPGLAVLQDLEDVVRRSWEGHLARLAELHVNPPLVDLGDGTFRRVDLPALPSFSFPNAPSRDAAFPAPAEHGPDGAFSCPSTV